MGWVRASAEQLHALAARPLSLGGWLDWSRVKPLSVGEQQRKWGAEWVRGELWETEGGEGMTVIPRDGGERSQDTVNTGAAGGHCLSMRYQCLSRTPPYPPSSHLRLDLGPDRSQNLGQRVWEEGRQLASASSNSELAELNSSPEHFGVPFLPEPQEEALVATALWFLPESLPCTLCSLRAGICFSLWIPQNGHIVGLGKRPQSELRCMRHPVGNGGLRNEQPREGPGTPPVPCSDLGHSCACLGPCGAQPNPPLPPSPQGMPPR